MPVEHLFSNNVDGINRNFAKVEADIVSNVVKYGFQAQNNGIVQATSAVAGTFVVVQYNSENDPYNVFDLANNRFVAPIAGLYMFSASVRILSPGAASSRWQIHLFVNASVDARLLDVDWVTASWSNDKTLHGSAPLFLAKGDLVDVRVEQNTGAANTIGNNTAGNYFGGGLIG